eukprot:355568-Chlamydomonas_euryale.AAC.2
MVQRREDDRKLSAFWVQLCMALTQEEAVRILGAAVHGTHARGSCPHSGCSCARRACGRTTAAVSSKTC